MYKSILLPVDLHDESSWRKALPVAVKLAEAFGAKLQVMTVVPEFGYGLVASHFPPDFQKKALESATKALGVFVKEKVPVGGVKAHVAQGAIYDEILRVAKTHGCDLVVMGSHRPELADYLIGPNAARVVRHAVQSVLVVRE
ncbi:MAG: universal stress protein [Kiloniellales bacterium]